MERKWNECPISSLDYWPGNFSWKWNRFLLCRQSRLPKVLSFIQLFTVVMLTFRFERGREKGRDRWEHQRQRDRESVNGAESTSSSLWQADLYSALSAEPVLGHTWLRTEQETALMLNHSAQHGLLTNCYKSLMTMCNTTEKKPFTCRHNISMLYVNSRSDFLVNICTIHILHTHKYVHLTHLLRQQVNILFVAALWSIVQLYQSQSLGEETELGHHDNSAVVCIGIHAWVYTHYKTLPLNTPATASLLESGSNLSKQ